jgi:hypothetical protein
MRPDLNFAAVHGFLNVKLTGFVGDPKNLSWAVLVRREGLCPPSDRSITWFITVTNVICDSPDQTFREESGSQVQAGDSTGCVWAGLIWGREPVEMLSWP